MRRVVVTGVGLVTPLADGVEASWTRLVAGQSGAGPITQFDASRLATTYACEVPRGDGSDGTFDADRYLEPKEQRKVDDFILYGIAAAQQAVQDAGWTPEDEAARERTGVMIGSGIGGLKSIELTVLMVHEKGPRRVSPFFIPGALINLISGQVSIRYGFKGPNHSVVTACSTGAHAIGDAARLIKYGAADVMVAGGAEAAICEIGIAGFNACKALSTKRAHEPQKASRPYDADRDGFVMGEGAGIVVLEEYEHAKARGARIYAEVLGYGMSGDAYHITAPAEDGEGAERSMRAALADAGLTPSDIDYINAHGTSTMADVIELGAVERLLGNAASEVTMSSTKSATGHLLGAAGAIEAIFSILAIRDQVAPPTINLDNPAIETPIDLAPNAKRERRIDVALSNSFGFGGTNASVIFGDAALMWRNIASNALTLFVVLLFLLGGLITWGVGKYRAPGPLAEAICLRVPTGATVRQVSEDLASGGAVSSPSLFRLGVDYQELAGSLKAGNFRIPAGASMQQIAAEITGTGQSTCGTRVVYRVGVTRTVAEVQELDPATDAFAEVAEWVPAEAAEPPAEYLAARDAPDTTFEFDVVSGVTSWQVVEAMRTLDIFEGEVAEVPPEGSLAPWSYEVQPGTDPNAILEDMRQRQEAVLADAWEARSPDAPVDTPQEALILASIVEKETGLVEERAQVASAFANRLRQGMKLQTDPTVIYGITNGQSVLDRGLRQSELRAATPYNTYVIDGLPPTPIANPSAASIEAALNPADTDYLFFVADGSGGHAFADNLDDHNRNVAAWREIEAEQAQQPASSDGG